MFTGIITDVGRVRSLSKGGDLRVEIETAYETSTIDIGASICCHGVCLTVVDKGSDWFAVNVSDETLKRSCLGGWREGSPVNLERSLKIGDELGGHIVTGHVDTTATVVEMTPTGDSIRVVFEVEPAYARFIASKGSVALNGTSLTVNDVKENRFEINIIPHTQTHTTFGDSKPGERVNLEVDILARYVARLGGMEE